MMKMMSKRILLCLAIFAMGFVQANDTLPDKYFARDRQGTPGLVSQITEAMFGLNPHARHSQEEQNNLSKYFLRSIFGRISHVLNGPAGYVGPGGLIALLFLIFNMGILAGTTFILLYGVVFSVSATSHDGGLMGSGRFSPFSFARVVSSVIALTPTFSGYSLIQLAVMKVIIAGVAIADIAWDATIDYVNAYGSDLFKADVVSNTNVVVDYGDRLLLDIHENTGTVPEVSPVASTILPDYLDYDLGISGTTQESQARFIQGFINPINVALLDSIYILRRCSPVMDGYMGHEVTPRFRVTRTAQRTNSVITQHIIRVDMEMRATPAQRQWVHCFDLMLDYPPAPPLPEIQANNMRFLMALENYIQHAGDILVSVHNSNPQDSLYSSQALRDGWAAELHTFYNAVKNSSTRARLGAGGVTASIAQQQQQLAGYKLEGWASAGLHFMDLLKHEHVTQNSNPRRYNSIGISHATLQNRRFSFNQNGVMLKPLALNVLRYQDSGPILRNQIKSRYQQQYGQTLPPVVNTRLIGWAYQRTQDVRHKLNEPISPPHSRKFNMGTITVDADIVAREIRHMSFGVANSILDAMSTDIDSGERARLNPGDPQNRYSNLRENPILVTQKLGKDIIGYVKRYYRESNRQLYDQITKAQQKAYYVAIAMSVVKGTAKAYMARYKAKRRMGQAVTDADKKARDRTSVTAKTAGLITDPIMGIIEFSQATAKAIVSIYLPYGNGLAAVYFIAGLILGVYIPFAPTLIFIFSILAWIFAVIEAMLAAPIVMTGFAHPEGHEIIGKTEQAIMLLIGVFIRPFVTLAGYLLSMILSVSLIKLFNNMILLSTVFYFRNITQEGINHTVPLVFGVSGLVVLYAYALMVVLQQCYSMIYVIPDQILKWIGGPAESAGAGIASVMRSVSTGLSQQSQSAAQGASGVSRGATSITTSHQ